MFFENHDVISTSLFIRACTHVKVNNNAVEVKLLKVLMPDFIPPSLWPPNSPDLNPVDYKIWDILQERVYKTQSKTSASYDSILLRIGISWTSAQLINQLDCGERDFERVWRKVEDSLKTKCEQFAFLTFCV